jgi:hypothetical protein
MRMMSVRWPSIARSAICTTESSSASSALVVEHDLRMAHGRELCRWPPDG